MLTLLFVFKNSQLRTFSGKVICNSKVIFMGDPDEKQKTTVDFGNDFSIHFHGCLTDPLN